MGIDMRLEAAQLVADVIGEVNRKVLYEREQKGRKDGLAEGLAEGRANVMEEMAVNLSDVLSAEEIAERTGLTIERVNEII